MFINLILITSLSGSSRENEAQEIKDPVRFVIAGAGPVGYYLAYKLSKQHSDAEIHMIDPRPASRPQVIRIPYTIAKELQQCPDIGDKVWPNSEIRSYQHIASESSPYGPRYLNGWPFVEIKDFQNIFHQYLLGKNFKSHVGNGKKIESLTDVKDIVGANPSAVFCTCGASSKMFRGKDEDYKKISENKGMFIVGNMDEVSVNLEWNPAEMKKDGITFAVSNNGNLAYQLYMYSENPTFNKLFNDIDIEEFKFTNHQREIESLKDVNDKVWRSEMTKYIKQVFEKHAITAPFEDGKLYSARRMEYYWKEVYDLNGVIYFGDSAGGTDWRLGISLGRGLVAIQDMFGREHESWEEFGKRYQKYWNDVIHTEFHKQGKYDSKEWTDLVYKKYFAVQNSTWQSQMADYRL